MQRGKKKLNLELPSMNDAIIRLFSLLVPWSLDITNQTVWLLDVNLPFPHSSHKNLSSIQRQRTSNNVISITHHSAAENDDDGDDGLGRRHDESLVTDEDEFDRVSTDQSQKHRCA